MPREDEFAELSDESELTGAHSATRPFTPEQLVACEECLRANAPTRMNCLYCGAALPANEQTGKLRRPTLKRLEEWEQGFNVVLLPRGASEALSPDAIEETASLLRLDAERLVEILEARRTLPLARAATFEEAELTRKRLGALGLDVEIFSDEVLTKTPMRARALALNEDTLVLLPKLDAEPRSVSWTEILLLVTGRIFTKRVEVAERETRLSSRSEIVESRELAADEAVLDVYTSSTLKDVEGFRIMADNFDYSCLGASKGLLARENFVALVEELRERAPAASLDEEYARMRGLLSPVWPPTERTESLGLRRDRPGRFSAGAATVFSNETQFTRYARLRSILALRQRAGVR